MEAEVISFNKTDHDPFIDFLKAYAIIFVIVAHNLPTFLWDYCLFRLWADMQVPMFILIQAFHAYKKGTTPKIKWPTLFKRIIIPFFLIQGLILLYRLLFDSQSLRKILITSVIGGGGDMGLARTTSGYIFR